MQLRKVAPAERLLLLLIESGVVYCVSSVRIHSHDVSPYCCSSNAQAIVLSASLIHTPHETLGDIYRPIHTQLSVRRAPSFLSLQINAEI